MNKITDNFPKNMLCALALFLSSCVAAVGSSIEVPDVPAGDAVSFDEMINSSVALGSFRDVRQEPDPNRISPEGEVTSRVKDAYEKSLTKRGTRISDSAPVVVHAEIRNWYAITKGTGEVESEASVYIEVHSKDSNRIFSALYHGSRASTFPLVTAQDISDSLGLAMAQAIDQSLYDQAMRAVLSTR